MSQKHSLRKGSEEEEEEEEDHVTLADALA